MIPSGLIAFKEIYNGQWTIYNEKTIKKGRNKLRPYDSGKAWEPSPTNMINNDPQSPVRYGSCACTYQSMLDELV